MTPLKERRKAVVGVRIRRFGPKALRPGVGVATGPIVGPIDVRPGSSPGGDSKMVGLGGWSAPHPPPT